MLKRTQIPRVLVIIGSLIIMLAFIVWPAGLPRDNRNPSYIWNYRHVGFYIIDPETILELIDKGTINVFVPLTDSSQVKDLNNTISWTQSDYLKIIDALSRFVWKEPLDLEEWKIDFIYFQTGCMNDLSGFRELDIIYYKSLGVKNWKRIYSSRIVEVSPWNGAVRWGEDTFSGSLLSNWSKVDLTKFSVTADNALKIAEENGGKDARLDNKNSCGISVKAPNSFLDNRWNVNYHSGIDFNVVIDPYSGKYQIKD
jgi:hypothetical protein